MLTMGSKDKPVKLDPWQRIVSVHWGAKHFTYDLQVLLEYGDQVSQRYHMEVATYQPEGGGPPVTDNDLAFTRYFHESIPPDPDDIFTGTSDIDKWTVTFSKSTWVRLAGVTASGSSSLGEDGKFHADVVFLTPISGIVTDQQGNQFFPGTPNLPTDGTGGVAELLLVAEDFHI